MGDKSIFIYIFFIVLFSVVPWFSIGEPDRVLSRTFKAIGGMIAVSVFAVFVFVAAAVVDDVDVDARHEKIHHHGFAATHAAPQIQTAHRLWRFAKEASFHGLGQRILNRDQLGDCRALRRILAQRTAGNARCIFLVKLAQAASHRAIHNTQRGLPITIP